MAVESTIGASRLKNTTRMRLLVSVMRDARQIFVLRRSTDRSVAHTAWTFRLPILSTRRFVWRPGNSTLPPSRSATQLFDAVLAAIICVTALKDWLTKTRLDSHLCPAPRHVHQAAQVSCGAQKQSAVNAIKPRAGPSRKIPQPYLSPKRHGSCKGNSALSATNLTIGLAAHLGGGVPRPRREWGGIHRHVRCDPEPHGGRHAGWPPTDAHGHAEHLIALHHQAPACPNLGSGFSKATCSPKHRALL